MTIDMRIHVAGLREFRAGLRGIDADLPKAVQRANKKFAQSVAPMVQSAYSQRYTARSGRGRGSIRALASQTKAEIAIGRSRVPYMIGQEFGSNRWPQFRPWTGRFGRSSRGRFLYPTVRDEIPDLVDEYGDVLSQELRDAFPEGGLLL